MRPSADNLAAIIAAIRRTVKRLSAADAVGGDRVGLSSRARRTMIMTKRPVKEPLVEGGNMNRLVGILLLLTSPLWATGVACAAERPDWAFPATDKVQPPSRDDGKAKTAPGSTLALTRAQIDDLFNPPDWYPDFHPPMPAVVAHGDQARNVRACASCHLPTGTGHDESAYLAGLPVAYFIRQMADYKRGERKGSGMMIGMAKTMTDEEVRAAAEYFAALKPRPWIRVVEADTVPKTYIGKGNKRLAFPDGGSEP